MGGHTYRLQPKNLQALLNLGFIDKTSYYLQ